MVFRFEDNCLTKSGTDCGWIDPLVTTSALDTDFCLDFNISDPLVSAFAVGWLVGWLVSYS